MGVSALMMGAVAAVMMDAFVVAIAMGIVGVTMRALVVPVRSHEDVCP